MLNKVWIGLVAHEPIRVEGYAHVFPPKAHRTKKTSDLSTLTKKISQNFSRGAYAARGGPAKKKKYPQIYPASAQKTPARQGGRGAAQARSGPFCAVLAACGPSMRPVLPCSPPSRKARRRGAVLRFWVGWLGLFCSRSAPRLFPPTPLGSAKWGRSALFLFPRRASKDLFSPPVLHRQGRVGSALAGPPPTEGQNRPVNGPVGRKMGRFGPPTSTHRPPPHHWPQFCAVGNKRKRPTLGAGRVGIVGHVGNGAVATALDSESIDDTYDTKHTMP